MEERNKTIWIIWYQGFDNAPELVKRCVDSWYYFNPNYNIVLLDNNNLSHYIDIKTPVDYARYDLTVQAKSELQRLDLLFKYGGVYTDATVFCAKPLDDWLPDYLKTGFFAFRNPGFDRMMSTWFLAAEKNNPILTTFRHAYFDVFRKTFFINKNRRIGNSLTHHLSPYFNKSIQSTQFWHSFFAKKVLRVYDYYFCHYTFNKIILENPKLAELWQETPVFEAAIPHVLQQLNSKRKDITRAITDIENRVSPLYKFDRRRNYSEPYWKGVLERLIALMQ